LGAIDLKQHDFEMLPT